MTSNTIMPVDLAVDPGRQLFDRRLTFIFDSLKHTSAGEKRVMTAETQADIVGAQILDAETVVRTR